ncbi:MAG TPA: efflux transporter outer membrane subunit [Caulobacteraceae bacterium]|nr:efflux transporter outer membrane subunit [Caulobacteraceae bacterium]
MTGLSALAHRQERPFRQASVGLGLLLTGALSACASLPGEAPMSPIKPAAAYATARSFDTHADPNPGAGWPADDWWRAYKDPQLDQLEDEALKGSPTLAQASARLDKARAVVGQNKASLLPTLSGQASVTEDKQSYNYGIPPLFVPHGYNDYGQTQLNFSYEFDFWGKNRSAVAASVSEAKAAQADAAEARLTLSTAVAAASADLARLYAERTVALRSVRSRQETLDLVARRVIDGADTQADQKQAEAGPPSARADLGAIDEQIATTRNQIAALLGQGPDRGLAVSPAAEPAPKAFGLPPRLAADLIGRRPDVIAARWRAEAAAKRVGVARAQFYPDINLVADIGFEALGVRNLFESGSDIGQVGPAVTLPIFEGGRLVAGLRGAHADYDEAVAVYDGALVEALHDVADAAAAERALGDRLKESRAALAAYEEAYRIARLRYDGGLADYQTVLLAEDSVLQSRRTVVDLEARAFTLDIQLVKALGGGYAPASPMAGPPVSQDPRHG